jgi:hypothetical protein
VAFNTYGNDSYQVWFTAEAMAHYLNRYWSGISTDEELLPEDEEDPDTEEDQEDDIGHAGERVARQRAPDGKTRKLQVRFYVPNQSPERYSELRFQARKDTINARLAREQEQNRARQADKRFRDKQARLKAIGVTPSRAKTAIGRSTKRVRKPK